MSKEELIQKVIEMIRDAKANNTFDLVKFVERPYKGFNTGIQIIHKLNLGTEDDFNSTLVLIEKMDISDELKDEIKTVLWVFSGIQEDAAIRRQNRREQKYLKMIKVPYPYDDDSDEYNVVIEDSHVKCELFDYLTGGCDDNLLIKEHHEQLLEAIDLLHESQKQIVTLVLIKGFKQSDVCKLLNLKKQTVSHTYLRGVENIKKYLKKI